MSLSWAGRSLRSVLDFLRERFSTALATSCLLATARSKAKAFLANWRVGEAMVEVGWMMGM